VAVDPRTWGIEQWSLVIAIAGLAFAFSQPFGFLLQWRQYSEERLAEDPVLRAEWAARLRGGSAGAAYRDALASTLAWLDRVFGPPGSARALGGCYLVAVAYAWATFFHALVWRQSREDPVPRGTLGTRRLFHAETVVWPRFRAGPGFAPVCNLAFVPADQRRLNALCRENPPCRTLQPQRGLTYQPRESSWVAQIRESSTEEA
jgi:hypothetical protein